MLDCEYTGNLHIHTVYSDGTGTIAEITKAARAAGLDFVGINDHHTIQAARDGAEGWQNDVLVLVGMENNHQYHHYLSYGISEEVPDNTDQPQQVIDAVNAQGGLGFIAHPFEKGSSLVFGGHAYTWNDWSVEGFTGICVWNYSSQWRDGATTVPKALYQAYIDKHRAITGPCPDAMKQLDSIAQKRRVTAIGGSDAHAVIVNYGPFAAKIFPYEFLFRSVNTHVLLPSPLVGNLEADQKKIYHALAQGHCFVAFDYYLPSKGFRYWAEKEDEILDMGEETDFHPGWRIRATLPGRGECSLVKDGQRIYRGKVEELDYPVERPGAYRLEVRQPRRRGTAPWIYSNHLYFRS